MSSKQRSHTRAVGTHAVHTHALLPAARTSLFSSPLSHRCASSKRVTSESVSRFVMRAPLAPRTRGGWLASLADGSAGRRLLLLLLLPVRVIAAVATDAGAAARTPGVRSEEEEAAAPSTRGGREGSLLIDRSSTIDRAFGIRGRADGSGKSGVTSSLLTTAMLYCLTGGAGMGDGVDAGGLRRGVKRDRCGCGEFNLEAIRLAARRGAALSSAVAKP